MFAKRIIPWLALIVLALTACNFPVATPTMDPALALFTQAAQTVEAQLTANAPIQTPTLNAPILPTNTPFVVNTPSGYNATPPTSTPLCDLAEFVADITVPDGTQYKAGETFTKTWRLRNQGTCTWNSGYALVFDEGNAMGAPLVVNLQGDVPPGEEVDISIEMTAPSEPGAYRGYWRMRNAAGVLFPILKGYKGRSFYVEIEVTPEPFAVLHVRYTTSTFDNPPTYQGCPLIVAEIETNSAGTVTYKWIQSDTADPNSVPEESMIFDSADSKLTPAHRWELPSTASGPHWIQLYIDEPNHQYFPKLEVTPCTNP